MSIERTEQQIQFEKNKLLYQAIPTANAGHALNAVVLVSVLWNEINHQTLTIWLTVILAAVALRFMLLHFYKQKAEHENEQIWYHRFVTASIGSALIWSAATIYLFPENSIIHQVFLIFIIGGMCTGALSTLSASLVPLLSFILLLSLPLISHLVYHQTILGGEMILVIMVYVVILIINAVRLNKTILQNIHLRIQNVAQNQTIMDNSQQYHEILNHIPIAVWLSDTDSRYKFVNQTFCDYLGLNEYTLLHTDNLEQLLGKEAARLCMESDQACLAKDTVHLSQEKLPFADGKVHTIDVTKVTIKNNKGEVTGILGIGIDSTEHLDVQSRFRMLSQAIEQSGESVIITDPDGNIEYVNPSFTKITGYSEQEAFERNPTIFNRSNRGKEFYNGLWKTVEKGQVWRNSIIDKRRDGTEYPAIATISPIRDKHGKITHYVSTQQDMTENEMLENRLRQAQKMEAVGNLVGGIAHDFNNMLAAVTGQLHIVKEMVSKAPDILEKVEFIERMSFDSAEMIKQLLMFSRKATVEMKPISLNSFAKEISRVSCAGIPENVEFFRRFSDHSLIVNADPTQLQQAIINLLNNARDAVAPKPDPKISYVIKRHKPTPEFITKYPEEAKQPYAHIIIKDNGTGVDPTNIQRLFEPFFTTKEVGSGTGLGLSMVYGTIQSHGGIIEVASKLDKGTTFHIYLPLIEAAAESTEDTSILQIKQGNGETILLVDDNQDVRNVGRTVLLKLGYQVIEAEDGLDAVEQFKENQEEIKLVLMDIIMPKLGGVEAFKRIKAISPQTKVIYTTGYDQDELQHQDAQGHEFTIITKPYRIHQFSNTVWQVLHEDES